MAESEDGSYPIFVVTVRNPRMESATAELAFIAQALDIASREARAHGGTKTTGVMIGHGGEPVGEWKYMPGSR